MFNKLLYDHLQRSWAAIAVGAVSIGVGVVKGAKAKKEAKALNAKREAYQTPDEVVDVLNATQANAQSGYDAATLQYLTDQSDQTFSSSLGIAERLGSDPNILSNIFAQNVDNLKGIAANNHQLQLQKFNAYLSALTSVGSNKAAEQKSQQELLRDQLQQVGVDKQVASGQVSQGINSLIAGAANYGMGQLYNPDGTLKVKSDNSNFSNTTYAATVAQQNAQNTRGFNP